MSRQNRQKPMARKKCANKSTVQLWLEELERRYNPSPISSTGALGNLIPSSEVDFNTTSGTYRIDGGSWQSGGVLASDPGEDTMLYICRR